MKFIKKIASCIALLSAMYSASDIESAIIIWVLEDQIMRHPAYLTINPVLDKQSLGLVRLLLSNDPAKLASSKLSIPFCWLMFSMIPWSFVLFKYQTISLKVFWCDIFGLSHNLVHWCTASGFQVGWLLWDSWVAQLLHSNGIVFSFLDCFHCNEELNQQEHCSSGYISIRNFQWFSLWTTVVSFKFYFFQFDGLEFQDRLRGVLHQWGYTHDTQNQKLTCQLPFCLALDKLHHQHTSKKVDYPW